MGAISDSDLREALDTQAADKLLDVFSWTEGRAWTQAGVRAMTLTSELSGWTPRQTILRGACRVNAGVVARRLEAYQACEVSQESLHLEEDENVDAVAGLWQAVGRPQRVRNLMNPHGTTLYALWLIGAVDLRADKDDTQTSLPVGPAAAVAESRPPRNALASFDGASHYQVLGIETGASDDEVRQASCRSPIFTPTRSGGALRDSSSSRRRSSRASPGQRRGQPRHARATPRSCARRAGRSRIARR
jgi:hypothetical protein